jgi:riboflavin biosynthesis pyrimidine reductase
MIDQVFPVKKTVPLEGLYLEERLRDLAAKIGGSVVLTDYLTDQNGILARVTPEGHFEIPREMRNSSDWARYQELMAQADVIISSGSYFRRLAGQGAQEILFQFEARQEFEHLGQWRLEAGLQRSPDVAIVSRSLDFEIPQELLKSGRRIILFTTDSMANSARAKAFRGTDIQIIGSGETDVDGGKMIDTLAREMGYAVIMMVSGPGVLDLLLSARCLHRVYITEAHIEIPFDNPAAVQTILPGGMKIEQHPDFHLAHQYIQEGVIAEDGSVLSQSFLRYDRNDL